MCTKTILITGAATRIGRALAYGLAEDGWRVAVHFHRSKNAAQKVAHDIGGVVVQADLSNTDEVQILISQASDALSAPLTALINNASTFTPDTAADFTQASYDNHMNVNLRAALMLCQDFAVHLPLGIKGNIINMIDQRVLRPRPDFFTYYLSKHALYTATQTLAQSFAPNIRVNAIGPGPTIQSVYQTEVEFQQEAHATLLGTGSPPATLVDAARFLLSASAVTGQMIAVDGGQHLKV